jgi:signal transduction histidine kinase
VQAGFLMYMPYYRGAGPFDTVEKRRAASKGFVYSPFRMDDLMKGILGPGLPDVHLKIFDGQTATPETLMYDSAPESAHTAPAFSKTLDLLMGQHHWTVRISSLPQFEAMLDPVKSYATLFAGVLASLLFFGVLWSFATTRQRAQTLAAEMTVALEEHANELTRSNEELESFAYVASHDLKAPLRGIDNLATWIEEDLGENLKGESRENMNLLRGRIKRLEALLSDLLAFSRAGQGRAKSL